MFVASRPVFGAYSQELSSLAVAGVAAGAVVGGAQREWEGQIWQV